MKALSRLKDPAAIQPLVDVLAANPNPGQMDLNNALIRFGPAAEPAVLTLFMEKNSETRRQACVILQVIGTTNSLAALQNMAGDSDQSLSQAAADAIRGVKMRQ
jgi:HEAT repeat protein